MASHRVIYKKKTTGFANVEERRIIRAVEESVIRRHRRSAIFTVNRRLDEGSSPCTSSIANAGEVQQGEPDSQSTQTEDRRTKLLKWKAEKELKKRLQKQMKPPAFRTGLYHHKLNSPIFLHQSLPVAKPSKPASPRITRATAKRIAAKKNLSLKEKTPLVPMSVIKSSKSKKLSTKPIILESSFAPENHQFKAPDGLPVLQLFGREALGEVKTPQETVPVYFSPYVISARGKRASRKEQQHNIELGEYLSNETMTKETDIQLAKTSDGEHEEEHTTSYFRSVTQKEVTRLRALCKHWMVIKTDDSISEDSQLVINQAIGQTNLFIDKKVEQFKRLIADCENGTGEKLVTCQDLQGFWDMMYMQVEDCDSRFNKLTQLQEKNWQEDEEPTIVKKLVAKRPALSKKIISSKSSSVRDMIRAARRKQTELQATTNTGDTIVSEPSSGTSIGSSRLSVVKFDGGFFMVESPNKTVTPKSVRTSALLQQSKFSDEAKHRRSALSLLRLSQKLKPPEAKHVEIESDPTIAYVNSQQTPGRSILKRIDALESASCTRKSQNKVIFSQTQDIPINNIAWLDESSNVTSDCEDNNAQLDIKKRLSLSDSDLDVEDAEEHREIIFEVSCDQRVDLLDKEVSNHSDVEDKPPQNSEADEIRQDEPSASLSLTEDLVNTTRTMRRTRKGILNECNETHLTSSNIQTIKTETPHVNENFLTNENHKENKTPSSPEITRRRRSTRKSVKFTEEDCTGCSASKPVHPMTPRVRRRTSKLPETPNESSIETTKQITTDLISWDTPKDPPARVRRSLRLKNSKQ